MKTDHLEYLCKTYLFEDLSHDQLVKVNDLCKLIIHKKGEYLCQEGDNATTMWILIEGEVIIKKSILLIEKGNLTPAKKVFSKLTGETLPCIGENGLFYNAKREATILCTLDSKFLQFERDSLLSYIQEDKDAGVKILMHLVQVLNQRLRSVNKDVLKLTTALSLALER